MKASNILKAACTATVSVACVWGLVGCSSADDSSEIKLTGGVAATVNGVEIMEDDVTRSIEKVRGGEALNLADEQVWGAWLAQNGYTPESVREEVIDGFVTKEVLKQGAAEKGITVEDSEVDTYFDKMRANYETDEAWQQALSAAGLTADEYRENLRLSILAEKVTESLEVSEEPSEDDLLAQAQTYATTYDGAKRSSHILFAEGDEATAQQVLDKINAGELDFAAAAQQYSKDGSAANGGDVGWDAMTSFVSEYQTALDGLEKDQVSGLVHSQFGIHIIKCTDVFTAPAEVTSLDQLPDAFVEKISASLSQSGTTKAYQDWLTATKESFEIVINDMPAEVPYNVDMSQFATNDTTEGDAATEANDAAAADGSEAGEADEAATDEAA